MEPPTHGIHQHIGRREVSRRLGVALAPTLHARDRIVFLLRAPDFDQRVLRHPALRGLDSRRLAFLLAVVRRPRRVAEPFALVTLREFQQRLE